SQSRMNSYPSLKRVFPLCQRYEAETYTHTHTHTHTHKYTHTHTSTHTHKLTHSSYCLALFLFPLALSHLITFHEALALLVVAIETDSLLLPWKQSLHEAS